ncbi:hypothetical protein GCM10007901_09220 [Dyella acidisoli]|uniref:Ribbon-helix-helix protein, CopG family n=1 Tax=Dyella acidisoli TaxID=1867834 RepID=A0ABQ5XN27_9GAMM|nr:hypothetical protein GCM10007901_09220 [Dyella acidisoli]
MEQLPRLSFCLTDQEIKAIENARQRLGRQGVLRNRSEVIRAAIAQLEHLSDDDLLAASNRPTYLKPGRKATKAK